MRTDPTVFPDWLVKHMIYVRTSEWPGPEAPHEPEELIREVGVNEPCPCGSGKKFKKCHRKNLEKQVQKKKR